MMDEHIRSVVEDLAKASCDKRNCVSMIYFLLSSLSWRMHSHSAMWKCMCVCIVAYSDDLIFSLSSGRTRTSRRTCDWWPCVRISREENRNSTYLLQRNVKLRIASFRILDCLTRRVYRLNEGAQYFYCCCCPRRMVSTHNSRNCWQTVIIV